MTALRATTTLVRRICEVLLVASLGLMSIAVFTQAFLRYVFSTTWLPFEDSVVYAFSISVFTGTALLFGTDDHIAITFLADALPRRWSRAVRIFADLVSLAFLLVLLALGISFARNGMHQFSPLLKVPLGPVYSVVPFSAMAGILFIIERNLIRSPTHPGTDSHDRSLGGQQ